MELLLVELTVAPVGLTELVYWLTNPIVKNENEGLTC